MEDFNALASSLAQGVGDVRGCLILSRDGLVLGAHPAEAEGVTTPAWVRFAAIGDPERGFAQFGMETWCYVRRGPYAGFALVGPRGAARPGDRPHGPGAARGRGGSFAARGAAGDRGRARGDGAPVQATVAPAPRAPHLRTAGDRGPGAELVAQIASADHADELPPLPSPGPEPIEADPDDDAEVPDLRPTPSPASWSSRATPRRRDRSRCPRQSRAWIRPPGRDTHGPTERRARAAPPDRGAEGGADERPME